MKYILSSEIGYEFPYTLCMKFGKGRKLWKYVQYIEEERVQQKLCNMNEGFDLCLKIVLVTQLFLILLHWVLARSLD